MTEKILLPIIGPDNPCGECNGACCRKGMTIPMTKQESWFMIENGASIERANMLPDKLETGELAHYYFLNRDCPFLVQSVGETAVCSIYDDPRKPSICDDFEAGGLTCINIKESRHSDQPTRPPEPRHPQMLF